MKLYTADEIPKLNRKEAEEVAAALRQIQPLQYLLVTTWVIFFICAIAVAANR
jgi:hypothetical protein